MINRTLDIGRDMVLLFVACSTFSSTFKSDMFGSARELLMRSGSKSTGFQRDVIRRMGNVVFIKSML